MSISIEGITKRFGSFQALDNISLEVPDGKLIGDFTVAKAGPERFYLFGSGLAEDYHMRWFEAYLPVDGSVTLRNVSLDRLGFQIAGPRSRDLLARVKPGDFVIITGLPGRNAKDNRLLLRTIERPADGFRWGFSEDETFE